MIKVEAILDENCVAKLEAVLVGDFLRVHCEGLEDYFEVYDLDEFCATLRSFADEAEEIFAGKVTHD